MGNASLEGKVIMVTGASKRVGRCYALALARAGAQVVAVARTQGVAGQPGSLAEVAAAGAAAGLDITPWPCDLSDEGAIRTMITGLAARFGGVDAVVNNAVAPMSRIDCMDVPADVWDAQMRVNVRAPYLLTVLAAPLMTARGGGSIVNITSLSGSTPAKESGAHEGLVHYGVSKAGLNRLTSYFAIELAEANIAVNGLSPGNADAYLRAVNNIGDEGEQQVVAGQQLDETFWGDPLVWLAAARPADMSGQIVHTYGFGESWGPLRTAPTNWSPEISRIIGG